MAVTSCVITDTLPADSTPKSFTRSGFGTPDAAIVIIGRANTVNNPQPEFDVSIGFWDGTNQYAASAHAIDNLDTTITSRFRYSNRIGGFRYHNGTNYVNIAQWTIANVTDGVQFTLTDDNTGAGHYATVILFKGVTNKKVGTFAFPGTASEVDVSDVGFKPDVVFMVDPVSGTAYSTALAESVDGSHINFGVAHNSSADVISQAGVTFASYSPVGTSQVNTSIHDKILRRWYADSTPASFTTSISAFDANGFSVTPSGATSSRPFYLALELPDPDDAYVGIIDSKTSTGTQAYTGVGFTPLAILLASTTETAINQSSTSPTGALYFGATDGTEEQSIIGMDQDAQNVSNVASRADTANVLNLRFHDDTVDAVAAYSSFDSDGWTLNYSDGSASARKILAFAIGDSTAGGGGATGTLAVTLADVTVSAAGALSIAGSVSSTLAAVELSGAGAVAIAGSASNTLGAATLAGSGALSIAGSASNTLGAATLAGSGALSIAGSASNTLGDFSLASAGAVPVSSSASNTLGEITGSSSASLPVAAAATITLDDVLAASTGALAIAADATNALGDVLVSGSGGAPAIVGEASNTLGDIAAAGSAALTISAAAANTLGDVTMASLGGAPSLVAEASNTLGAITAAGAGTLPITAEAAASLGAVAITGAAALPILAAMSASLGTVSLASAGALPIVGVASNTLGAFTAVGDGELGFVPIQASLAQALGAITASGDGALGPLPIGADLAVALGSVTAAGAAQLTIAAALAQALGAASVAATGSVSLVGVLNAALGSAAISSSGSLPITGAAAIQLGAAALTSSAGLRITGTLAQALGELGFVSTSIGYDIVIRALNGTLRAYSVLGGSIEAEPAISGTITTH